jgi:hypothetical protein
MTHRGGGSNKVGEPSVAVPAPRTPSGEPPREGTVAGEGTGAPRAITGGEQSSAPVPAGADDADGPRDVVYVHQPTEAGDGYQVVRQRKERIELGEIRPMREGRPIQGEIVRLTPRAEGSRLFDVDVLYEPPRARAHAGPARVASEPFRRNWDDVFGKATSRNRGGDGQTN